MDLQPIDTEKMVLGTLLVSSGTKLVLIDDVLKVNFFSNEYNKNIYEWVLKRFSEGKPADIISLVETVGPTTIKKFGGPSYVCGLGDNTIVTDERLRQYAQRIHSHYRLRKLKSAAQQILGHLEDLDLPPEEIIRIAETSVLDVSGGVDSIQSILSMKEAAAERKASWKRIMDGKEVEYVPTGFGSFDDHYVGWPKGYMTIIGGRPEIGKTMFLVSAVLRAAMSGIPQGVLSIEMPRWKLIDRMASIIAGVPITGLHEKSESDAQSVMDAADQLMKEPIYLDDASSTADSVESSIRRMARQHGCQVIWVDYLQLIRPPAHLPSNRNRSWEVDEISETLRRCAKQENVAIIALMQLNRGTEESFTEGRKGVPGSHHFRGSDKPLHDSALAFGLYRQFQYKKPKKDYGDEYTNEEIANMFQPFELISLKSRDHSKKSITLWSRLKLQRVYDDADDGFTCPNWGSNFGH
jgi:replicative DNA helicase